MFAAPFCRITTIQLSVVRSAHDCGEIGGKRNDHNTISERNYKQICEDFIKINYAYKHNNDLYQIHAKF